LALENGKKSCIGIGKKMIKIETLNIGSKVHYQPEHYNEEEWENGLVKELRAPDGVWVVYNCSNEWERYIDYTAAKTHLRDLRLGWKNKG
jgi:hypothetical protein